MNHDLDQPSKTFYEGASRDYNTASDLRSQGGPATLQSLRAGGAAVEAAESCALRRGRRRKAASRFARNSRDAST